MAGFLGACFPRDTALAQTNQRKIQHLDGRGLIGVFPTSAVFASPTQRRGEKTIGGRGRMREKREGKGARSSVGP